MRQYYIGECENCGHVNHIPHGKQPKYCTQCGNTVDYSVMVSTADVSPELDVMIYEMQKGMRKQ